MACLVGKSGCAVRAGALRAGDACTPTDRRPRDGDCGRACHRWKSADPRVADQVFRDAGCGQGPRAGLRRAWPEDSRAGRVHALGDRHTRRRKRGSGAVHAIRSPERMTERVVVDGLSVAKVFHDFISKEALPGTGVPEAAFWARLSRLIHDLAPRNRALLKKRDDLQAKIDAWHRARKGQSFDLPAYK